MKCIAIRQNLIEIKPSKKARSPPWRTAATSMLYSVGSIYYSSYFARWVCDLPGTFLYKENPRIVRGFKKA